WVHGPSTPPIPRSVVVIHAVLSTIMIGGLRMALRSYFQAGQSPASVRSSPARKAGQRANVAIYGAGAAGMQLLVTLQSDPTRRVIAFLDDDPQLQGRTIGGVPVHDPLRVGELAERKMLKEVLLAMPSASRSRRRAILDQLAHFPFAVRTVPGFADLASGRLQVNELREVDI